MLLNTKPNFVDVGFAPFCNSCKHPKPKVVDFGDNYNRIRIKIYCENINKCMMLYEYALDQVKDELKEIQE